MGLLYVLYLFSHITTVHSGVKQVRKYTGRMTVHTVLFSYLENHTSDRESALVIECVFDFGL
jgi:hypothetical protein